MREFEVLYSTKAAGPKGHPEKSVVEIGAGNWRLGRDAAISWLGTDAHTFYVNVNGQRSYLVVVVREGQSCLRTSKEWTEPNLLLQLPDFPKAAE